mgnify:CR=1 FL=1
MKNLIVWGAFFAVLGILSQNVGDFLQESGLVPYVVGGTIVFAIAFKVVGIKPVKGRKKRSTVRKKTSRRKVTKSKPPTVGAYRTNGSYIPQQYRQNSN